MTFSVRRPTTRPRPGDRSNKTRPEKNEGETSFLFIWYFVVSSNDIERRLCCSLTIVYSIAWLDLAVYICIKNSATLNGVNRLSKTLKIEFTDIFRVLFFLFLLFFLFVLFFEFFAKFPQFPSKNRGWEAFRRQAACVRYSSTRLRRVFHLRLLLYFCSTVLPDL